MFFFCHRISHLGYHTTLRLWLFFQTSLVFGDLTAVRNTGQLFGRVLHYWSLPHVFSHGKTGVPGFWKNTEVRHHFHHVMSAVCTIHMIHGRRCWLWLYGQGYVCNVSPLFIFFLSILNCLGGSHWRVGSYEGGVITYTSWNFSAWGICPHIYSCFQ